MSWGSWAYHTAEYLLRLWIAERPWKYAFSLYGLIDLAAILPFYLAWGTETTALRVIRLLRIIRLWKHKGYTRAWIRFGRALRESRKEATIFLVASALTLYIATVGIHQCEDDAIEQVEASEGANRSEHALSERLRTPEAAEPPVARLARNGRDDSGSPGWVRWNEYSLRCEFGPEERGSANSPDAIELARVVSVGPAPEMPKESVLVAVLVDRGLGRSAV